MQVNLNVDKEIYELLIRVAARKQLKNSKVCHINILLYELIRDSLKEKLLEQDQDDIKFEVQNNDIKTEPLLGSIPISKIDNEAYIESDADKFINSKIDKIELEIPLDIENENITFDIENKDLTINNDIIKSNKETYDGIEKSNENPFKDFEGLY